MRHVPSSESSGGVDVKFDEFMARYRPHHAKIVADMASRQLFTQRGTTKNGKIPVFYFAANRYVAAECDFDHVIYAILSLLKPHLRSQFVVVCFCLAVCSSPLVFLCLHKQKKS